MKMTLTGIFFILAGIIYTEATDVAVDVNLIGCTDTDGEFMYGLDGEEMAHSDWKAEKLVMTLPKFADPFKYVEGAYESSIGQIQICRANLAVSIQANKNPAVAEAPPMSSIYPKSKVKVGTENSLICYITAFYPPRLNVTWTKNNKMMTQGVSTSQLRVNLKDGTYTMISTLQFTPQDGDMYTCTVEHSALDQPMTREFDVEVPAEPSLGPAVFCGVGLTLGLLGVATGTFFLVKGNQCN
ncbi:H-2 class II histocompatibility antigen, A-U alpha chain-like [Alosa sapidissima]|uniref:H-2 class II histocompatibility antigen, A-U alpha chain-like n=1 Tax=Alosa sapidissima TaxID=34773 RepID=UPI001C08BE2C|nr:H-2 class II histocompatibility antigen, A-U alpha chain-like [Alosa sapidissima]